MMDSLLFLTPPELLNNYGVISAFLLSISIIALSFIAGESFNMPSIKGFAKKEGYELCVSAVILVIALVLLMENGPFDMVAKGFMLPGVPVNRTCADWSRLHGPYDPVSQSYANGSVAFGQADYFIGCRPTLAGPATFPEFFGGTVSSFGLAGVDGVVLRRLTLGYQSLMMTEMVVGFLSGLSTNVAIEVPVMPVVKFDVGLIPWIGMGQINDIHTLLVDLVGQVWAAFAGQKLLLVFIEEAAIPFFLPLGILMRAFIFTRKTGSTIIAVVFAAYFIYPISILINQHIWEAIVDPTENIHAVSTDVCTDSWGNPACCPNSGLCNIDADCCSDDCRPTGSSGVRKCVSPLTDFTQYRTLFSVCYGTQTPEEINQTLYDSAQAYNNGFSSLYFTGSASDAASTKASERVGDFMKSLWNKAKTAPPLAESLAIKSPRKVMVTAFSMVEVLVMDVSQYLVLALVFVVIEIIITLTLMKDFALLIGGEPRVLGITQLV